MDAAADPSARPHLAVEAITKSYGSTQALSGFSLSVARGAFVALLGPSGCGKSTLLKIIAGLIDPDAGRQSIADIPLDGVPAYRRDIGLVFQSYALFPHLSVNENIRFGLAMRKVPAVEAAARVTEALALVKLDGYGKRMPAELSGGQQQRVALARAIVIRPRLLLLDEPLSNLDAVLRKSVRLDIRELHDRTGLTTLMVTHDQEEAMSMADRIAVMAAGRILQYDTPERIYERPATTFVASFVGSPPAALLPARRNGDAWRIGTTLWRPAASSFTAAVATKAEIVIALRPERVALAAADAPDAIAGTVHSSEYLGGTRLVHVDVGDRRVAVVAAGAAPAAGTAVGIRPGDDGPLAFDAATGERIGG